MICEIFILNRSQTADKAYPRAKKTRMDSPFYLSDLQTPQVSAEILPSNRHIVKAN